MAAGAAGPAAPDRDPRVGGIDIVADDEIVIVGESLEALPGIVTQTFGARPAGPITIRTPLLSMPRFGTIDSSTRGDGSAGAIVIAVDRLVMGPITAISSSNVAGADAIGRTESTGSAGTIEVTATGPIEMVGSSTGQLAGIGTTTTAAGAGGSVRVTTPRLRIAHGGITSESTGAGDAGDIALVIADRLEMDNGAVATDADAAGGGRISIAAGELIELRDSAITTSVRGDMTTTAGDIAIDPRFLVLDGSRIIAQADAGRGGNIAIEVGTLLRAPDGLISASAGPAGIDAARSA